MNNGPIEHPSMLTYPERRIEEVTMVPDYAQFSDQLGDDNTDYHLSVAMIKTSLRVRTQSCMMKMNVIRLHYRKLTEKEKNINNN